MSQSGALSRPRSGSAPALNDSAPPAIRPMAAPERGSRRGVRRRVGPRRAPALRPGPRPRAVRASRRRFERGDITSDRVDVPALLASFASPGATGPARRDGKHRGSAERGGRVERDRDERRFRLPPGGELRVPRDRHPEPGREAGRRRAAPPARRTPSPRPRGGRSRSSCRCREACRWMPRAERLPTPPEQLRDKPTPTPTPSASTRPSPT